MSMNQVTRRLTLNDLIVPNGQTNQQETFHSQPYISRLRHKTDGQLNVLETLERAIVTFCHGPSGTGKTFLAVGKAMEWLHQGIVKRIILSKPVLECGERLGFMPGEIEKKIEQPMRPLTDKLNKFLDEKIINKYIIEKKIELIPLAYMRGVDLDNACLILDEAQNATKPQLLMFLTRIGENSRAIICGDTDQTDLREEEAGAFHRYIYEANQPPFIDGLEIAELTEKDIVRSTIVQRIVKKFGKIKVNDSNRKSL